MVTLNAFGQYDETWRSTFNVLPIIKSNVSFNYEINDYIRLINEQEYHYKYMNHNDVSKFKYLHKPQNTNLNSYPLYNNLHPTHFFSGSKINLRNDSLNASHTFYEYDNLNQKTLSFIQLGMQNFLSEKIISLGGGSRYLNNNQYAFGYNIFYHHPSTYQYNQPCAIGIGGEYWIHQNTLFTINSYCNLNSLISIEQSSQKNSQLYPKTGYQIGLQTKLPFLSKFIGKLQLEHCFYNLTNNALDTDCDHNKNHIQLALGLEYQPIPILGLNINKYFINNQNNSTVQISLNYQFNVPILQQIYHTNQNNELKWNGLGSVVQPFMLNTTIHKKECTCSSSRMSSLSDVQKISGNPGEIKIININNPDNKCITWNHQSLQDHGGKIKTIHHNMYAIHMPCNNLTQSNNKITLTYTINDKRSNTNIQQSSKKIIVIVNNLLQNQPSCTSQQKDFSKSNTVVENVNNDSGYNTTNNSVILSSTTINQQYNAFCKNKTILSPDNLDTCNKTNDVKKIEPKPMLKPKPKKLKPRYLYPRQSVPSKIMTNENNVVVPIPPPMPKKLIYSHLDKSLNDSNVLLSSSIDSTNDLNIPSTSSMITSNKNPMIAAAAPFNKNSDFASQLFAHRQNKFSCIDSKDYLQKLEETIALKKKENHPNSIEKMLITSYLSEQKKYPSSSSSDEGPLTDDNNSDHAWL